MNVAGLLATFSTGTYTVARTAAHTLSHGKATSGTASSVTITASVSPSQPMDLLRLPEGRRATDTVLLFTTTELFNGGQGSAYEADKVTIDGESWEVNIADKWKDPRSGSTMYRCLLSVVR